MPPLKSLRQFWPLLVICAAAGCQTASSHNLTGVRQFQNGQYRAALDNFQQAVSLDPNNADAYYNLAATLHDWGRSSRDPKLLGQAEDLYNRCIDLSPDHVDCHRGLSVLLVDTRRKDRAFNLLERWAQRRPQLADPRIELARLHEEFGDDNTAKQYLTQALDVQAHSPRAWAALGRLREEEGRLAQALANYQHAYSLNRYQPGVQDRLAALQHRLARTDPNRYGTSGVPALASRPQGAAWSRAPQRGLRSADTRSGAASSSQWQQ